MMKYVMTAYGALPLTNNAVSNNDNTCQNYNYMTVDQGLGLNRSSTSYLDTQDSGYGYESIIDTATNAKMNRICSNINAVGVDIYIIYQLGSSTLGGTACSNSAGNVFNISNTQSAMTTALSSIYTKIMAKQAPFH
jgi:hypothetical protein